MRKRVLFLILTLLIVLLTACQGLSTLTPNALSPDSPTLTPFQPITWVQNASEGAELNSTPSETSLPEHLNTQTPPPPGSPAPFSLWIDPNLPTAFRQQLRIPNGLPLAEDADSASLNLRVDTSYPVSQWVYALVAPFPTVVDGVTAQDLRAAWKGETRGEFRGLPLMMDEITLGVLSAYWGKPAEGAVQVRSPDKLLKAAWDQRLSWAIVPFEDLNPQWKVLNIDGISPIHKDFDQGDYELVIPISMTGVAPELPGVSASNRNPEKMTVLAMTGVTALVRATAFTMEQQGNTYPALDIGPILQGADITHISNEVPFAENCPYPNPVQQDVRFCSRTKYIELLEHIDTDIVELTGDHFADWGAEAMYYTLELYNKRGWPYYGGGANFKEGRQAVLIEHNDNKLAFIGCNAKGGGYATATTSNPGAVYCDWEWMQNKIAELRAEDYLPIATFQHFEYYTYVAQPNQVRDAGRMTGAGAIIVSGSQAHQPQAFGFSDGGFIHHGLGNLFFDQLDVSEATRQGFIDLHVFYNGQHISTELITIYFIDYARARLMTPQERANLLRAVFSASGW
jgi:poly-gamma-glutamate synthesis protein (capsule biosynthesis protein)